MKLKFVILITLGLIPSLLLGQVQVAIAQIFCLDGDREGNFRRIENAIIDAVDLNADIVCFPEMSILGWINPQAHQLAHPIPGKDFYRLASLAQKYQVYICIGLAEKENDLLYDAVVLIDDTGELLLKHRKINILTELMDPPYTPGKSVQAVDTKFGKIGLLICADSFVEEILSKMKSQEPQLVLIPYGWAKEQEDWPGHGLELEKTVKNAAQKMDCWVVGTDLVGAISYGPWKGRVYGGQSIVSNHLGQVKLKCKDRDSDIQVIQIGL